MASAPFIGIDFGTCNSSAAWFNPRTGQAETLLNAEGEDKTPSVVYFGPNETVVGKHAEERLESPEDTQASGDRGEAGPGQAARRLLGDRRLAPLDVAAEILGKTQTGCRGGPFPRSRDAGGDHLPCRLRRSGEGPAQASGPSGWFPGGGLLEEPVAAALAYAEAGMNVGRYVLVYDLGGGTFDLALLDREEGDDAFRLAMEPRGDRIGGEDFDRAIYDYFDADFRKKLEQPICPDGLDLHLLRQCRRLRRA